MARIDAVTKRWIRNAADQRAAKAGYRFDEERGQHVVDFFRNYLRLYEGDFAGQPFDPQEWQEDFLKRCFGWVGWCDERRRWLRRFRKASLWVPKKNGKSPFAAGIGLYLFCFDGEQGQKVFSVARDGKQATIMHTHAIKMVELSPELSAECVISKGTGQISHPASNSLYSILCGDNIESQEGLNGSSITDETHVVDERLKKRLEYMGASRAEPLDLEVSTAGTNPQGYGKKQFDYGRAVDAGTIVDDRFLHVEYGAPQDATDADCSDPAMWAKANPSWGVTIHESEMRQSCDRAKKSLPDWQAFKMYRLNVWADAASPWLRRDDWKKCGRKFTLDDLRGRQCWGGLDLSKTRDMSSLVLVFREEGSRLRVWPLFWFPEEEAKRKSHVASYLDWAAAGHIKLIPGPTICQRFILADVRQLLKRFELRLQQVRYDRTYAHELTATLEDEDGISRAEFPQTVMAFAGPTAEVERMVISGELEHPGNPVLDWQAGHVTVSTDKNGNRRPVKPDHASDCKIDGIVALIEGVSGALAGEEQQFTFYNNKKLEIG